MPVELAARDDARLVEWRLALVNLCPRPTRSAAELTRAELQRGVKRLARKARALRPEAIALVGVTLYPLIFGRGGPPGPGAKPETLAGARVFVLPNPSGLNASYPSFRAKLAWFVALREWLDHGGGGMPAPPSR